MSLVRWLEQLISLIIIMKTNIILHIFNQARNFSSSPVNAALIKVLAFKTSAKLNII